MSTKLSNLKLFGDKGNDHIHLPLLKLHLLKARGKAGSLHEQKLPSDLNHNNKFFSKLPVVHARRELARKFHSLHLPPINVLRKSPPRVASNANKKSARGRAAGRDYTQQLSDELLLNVLSFLSPADLMHAAGLVCRRWMRLSRDRSLWSELNLALIPVQERSGVLEQLGAGLTALRVTRFSDLVVASRFCVNVVHLNVAVDDHDAAGRLLLTASRLADMLVHFRSLRELHVSPALFAALPAGEFVERLPVQLEVLWLIGRLPNLHEAPDAQPVDSFLPATISRLTRLSNVTLCGFAMRDLPPELFQLPNLSRLNVCANMLDSLPSSLGGSLSSSASSPGPLPPLSSAASSMMMMSSSSSSLRWLYLASNRLETLPRGALGRLTQLRYLNLEENLLRELPPDIGLLASCLESLCLAANALSAFPPEFKRLTSLTALTVDDTAIPLLPGDCGAWPNLKFINHCHPDLVYSMFALAHPLLAKTRLNYLHRLEEQYAIDPHYVDRQTFLTPAIRAMLVRWECSVMINFPGDYKPEITGMLFAAVNIIDQFLQRVIVERQDLQLLGIVSLYMGLRLFADPNVPSAVSKAEFLAIFHERFTLEDFEWMEGRIMAAHVVAAPTVFQFYRYMACCAEMPANPRDLLTFELLLEYSFLKYRPSELAVTAIYCERLRFFDMFAAQGAWLPELEAYSGKTVAQVELTAVDVIDLLASREVSLPTETFDEIRKHILVWPL